MLSCTLGGGVDLLERKMQNHTVDISAIIVDSKLLITFASRNVHLPLRKFFHFSISKSAENLKGHILASIPAI